MIDTNVITTTESNSDLELAAAGTGSVRVSDSLGLDQNLTVSSLSTFFNVNASNLTITGSNAITVANVTSPEFNNGDIIVSGNVIKTTTSNSNLELRANSAAGIIVDQTLQITNSTISNILGSGTESDRSVVISPYSNRVLKFNSTNSLRIPVGNNTTRILSNTGEIRFNNLIYPKIIK